MNIDFGKRTTHESYFNGALKSTKVEYSIPELIKDKTQTQIDQAVEDGAIQRTTLEVVNNYGEQDTFNPQQAGENK